MSRQRIAVVGGPAGIGAGLARAAAARGLDVVVLGRNASAEMPPDVHFSRPQGAATTKVLFEIASRSRVQGVNGG